MRQKLMTPEQQPEVDTASEPPIDMNVADQEQQPHFEDQPPIETPQQANESLKNRVLRTKAGRIAVASMCSVAAMGAGASAATASERSSDPNTSASISSANQPVEAGTSSVVDEPEVRTINTVHVGRSKTTDRAISSGRVSILGNHRTVSRGRVREAFRDGDCKMIDGSERPVWTEGIGAGGATFGRDTRTSLFCKVGGEIFRAACGNEAEFRPPEDRTRGKVIWVNNIAKARLAVRSRARAKAVAECRTDNTYAYAEGRGAGAAAGRTRVGFALRAGGRGLDRITTQIGGRASAKAKARAGARAEAKCQEETQQVTEHEKPKPKPKNQPPTGRLPLHERIVDTTYKVCADDLSDPNGDNVSVTDFRFTNSEGEPTGREIGNIYTESGSDGKTQCQEYETPSTPQEVDVEADLHDGRGGETTLRNSMPVVDRGF